MRTRVVLAAALAAIIGVLVGAGGTPWTASAASPAAAPAALDNPGGTIVADIDGETFEFDVWNFRLGARNQAGDRTGTGTVASRPVGEDLIVTTQFGEAPLELLDQVYTGEGFPVLTLHIAAGGSIKLNQVFVQDVDLSGSQGEDGSIEFRFAYAKITIQQPETEGSSCYNFANARLCST